MEVYVTVSSNNCQRQCSSSYEPVCATDGVSYDNKCHLSIKSCENPSVQLRYEGPCGTSARQESAWRPGQVSLAWFIKECMSGIGSMFVKVWYCTSCIHALKWIFSRSRYWMYFISYQCKFSKDCWLFVSHSMTNFAIDEMHVLFIHLL